MKFIASWKRIGCYLAGSFLTVSVGLTVVAFTPRIWGAPQNGNTFEDTFTVYVSGDGMHTNFFVPVQTTAFNWNDQLDLEQISSQTTADYRYLQFGWGDRVFYMETPSWKEVSVTSALRALFLQNPSAMLVKGHATAPDRSDQGTRCIRLTRSNYLALMNFIATSFQTDQQGRERRIGTGQDGDSGFYAANGNYSILRTCNSWTADGLRAANVNTPLWAGLAPAVMFQLRNKPCS